MVPMSEREGKLSNPRARATRAMHGENLRKFMETRARAFLEIWDEVTKYTVLNLVVYSCNLQLRAVVVDVLNLVLRRCTRPYCLVHWLYYNL